MKRKTIERTDEKEHASRGGPTPRRRFLNRLWMILGGIAAAEVIGLVIAFLKPGKNASPVEGYGGLIACGPASDFSAGTVTAFQRGHFYLSRMESGGFLALSRKCTHLGCTVIWDEEKGRFECPCHASAFDRTGDVISKPAPRALDYYSIIIENGMVTVDTGKRLKRKHFRTEQVTSV
ncbi:MAG: Rieske (2Fe-2S) protein [Deltaproteobacteria bacterium]|nr:Rieske (2Fe-2S) protein [Deltaproteobacteria bacterium]